MQYGVKLVRINRAVSFSQSLWMREYVELNTKLRMAARNKFEESFFKLLVNSIYGKMLESLRHKRDFRLVCKPHLVQKWINKPNFKSSVLLNRETNLFLIELSKTSIRLNRPVIVGMTVLDLAKSHMTWFHYGIMKPLFPKPHKLYMVYTDTDSFVYEIKLANDASLYEILAQQKTHFDFSNYPPNHVCYDPNNRKVLGKFKDETSGYLLSKFIGLRPKLYSLEFLDKVEKVTKVQENGTLYETDAVVNIKKAKGLC